MDDNKQDMYKVCLEYGVELFKYHAEQRLRCIRYYTTFLGLVVAGLFTFLGKEKGGVIDPVPCVLFVLIVFSGVTLFFWLIDIRNRVLTESAENGLKRAEAVVFEEGSMHMVSNCENNSKKAWHYSGVVPWFFGGVMFLILITSIALVLHSTSMRCYLWLFSVFIGVFLIIGFCRESVYSKFSSREVQHEYSY